jgi:hypothetical protein
MAIGTTTPWSTIPSDSLSKAGQGGIPGGYASAEAITELWAKVPPNKAAKWTLLMRQSVPTYKSKSAWASMTPGNVNDANYVNKYALKMLDGKYEMKYVLPHTGKKGPTGKNYVHWRQTSNPFTSNSVSGYEAVDLGIPSSALTGCGWGGFALGTSNAWLDGTPTSTNWFMAIGTTTPWSTIPSDSLSKAGQGGIPGGYASAEAITELWVFA